MPLKQIAVDMDVSRIMQDLSIEQLAQLQTSLEREIETKKEELRQMVGRRYRDVLEASNAVRRLNEISDELVIDLHDMHRISSLASKDGLIEADATFSRVSSNATESVHDFVLLNAFLSQVGEARDDVSDAFCLLLANAFYQRFSSKARLGEESHRLLKAFFDRLIVVRLELVDRLTIALGRVTDWPSVTGTLAALALLKQTSVEALLDAYLAARLDHIFLNLKSSSSTLLIGIFRMMRDTTQIVEDVFGPGEAMLSALRVVTTPEWCPDYVQTIVDDQLCDYAKIFRRELCKINAAYPAINIAALPLAFVRAKNTTWIEQMCEVAKERVRTMSDHFERTAQVVEFVVAINQLFKSEWSSAVTSNVSIYDVLFGDAIVRRFGELIHEELYALERRFHDAFPGCNCDPQPLFQKRAVKFDALLASGVSKELNDLVRRMFDEMRDVTANVNKYVAIGCESDIARLRDVLADAVLQLVHRFLFHFNIPVNHLAKENAGTTGATEFQPPTPTTLTFVDPIGTSSTTVAGLAGNAKADWLRVFRLFLAFVQHEPSAFCACMNRDFARITRCNKQLHYATEYALCRFMREVIDECVVNSRLSDMPTICSSELQWLDLVEEFERSELPGAGHVDVPIQLSRHFFQFLYAICREINATSIGHLLTSNVTNFIAKQLGVILSANLLQCARACAPSPRICVQLLFDARALFIMFPNHLFVDAAHTLEAKLDAVERKIIDEPLARNTKTFTQRTSVLFGQLLADTLLTSNARDNSNPRTASLSALVDMTPKVADICRLALIPRLSKLRTDEEDRRRKSGKQGLAGEKTIATKRGPVETLAEATSLAERIPSAASFSSLYGKISSGWFKNNQS